LLLPVPVSLSLVGSVLLLDDELALPPVPAPLLEGGVADPEAESEGGVADPDAEPDAEPEADGLEGGGAPVPVVPEEEELEAPGPEPALSSPQPASAAATAHAAPTFAHNRNVSFIAELLVRKPLGKKSGEPKEGPSACAAHDIT
jgi:hypothetical protein